MDNYIPGTRVEITNDLFPGSLGRKGKVTRTATHEWTKKEAFWVTLEETTMWREMEYLCRPSDIRPL